MNSDMNRGRYVVIDGEWAGTFWRVRGETPGELVGVIQFFPDGLGYDPLTDEFDVDKWERGSQMLMFPLTRDGWRSVYRSARSIARQQGARRLVLESWRYPPDATPDEHGKAA